MLQPMILLFFFVFWWEVTNIFLIVTHRWDCWSSQNNSHSRGTLFATRILYFYHVTTAFRFHFCGCWYVLSVEEPYVTRYNWHLTRTHKAARILSVLDRFWQRGQEDMMITRIVSARSFFSSLDTPTRSQWSANWLVGLEPNSYQNKVLHTRLKMVCDSRSHQNKTTKDKWRKWREDGRPSQTDVNFVVMYAFVSSQLRYWTSSHWVNRGESQTTSRQGSKRKGSKENAVETGAQDRDIVCLKW